MLAKFLQSPHAITLALIAATMLILEVAQPRQSRLLADDLAADQASLPVPGPVSGIAKAQTLPLDLHL